MNIRSNARQRASRELKRGVSATCAAVLSAWLNYAGIRSDAKTSEPQQYATQQSIPSAGSIVGRALGGWVTDSHSWSWIIHINASVVLFALIVTWMIYHNRESLTHMLPLGKVGPIARVIWVASPQSMLEKGKELDWFSSPMICTLIAFAAISFLFFIHVRRFVVKNFHCGTIAI